MQQPDMNAAADMAVTGTDMKVIAPFNMPGEVDCYGITCSTTGADPICCDSQVDGGFTDTCVASAGACTGSSAKTFACGQKADCSGGQVCCGDIGKATSGKQYFKSTTCAASCASPETQLCVNGSECLSGGNCVGADISGRNVGLCQ
jgi:hypothetical protein